MAGLKRVGNFEMSVAGYPEKHPESPSLADDLDNLKAKVDAGASRIITQFFFDNAHYLRFLEAARARGIWAPIVAGIVPIHNFKQVAGFAGRCGATMPSWMARRFDGLDDDPQTTHLVAAAMAAEQVMDLVDQGIRQFHFYTLNRADLVYAICHLLGLQADRERWPGSHEGGRQRMTREQRIAALKSGGRRAHPDHRRRHGHDDPALQASTRRTFRGKRFAAHPKPVQGNNDLLVLTKPEAISEIHDAYLEAGADIISSNTFNCAAHLARRLRHGGAWRYEMNLAAAKLARATPPTRRRERRRTGRASSPARSGPTNRTASISPDVNNPGFRNVTFDELVEAYTEQARGLIEGGVDVLLIETVFDTLNAKAAGFAVLQVFDEMGVELPLIISGTITDRSGRTLSGQTPEAFFFSIRHLKPFAVGLNCALGAELMRPYLAEIAAVADTLVIAYPNAGLPNAMGEYDEGPHDMACQLGPWAKDGLLNIVGGCCGSTPEHIAEIAAHVAKYPPRKPAKIERRMRLSGLEPFVHG